MKHAFLLRTRAAQRAALAKTPALTLWAALLMCAVPTQAMPLLGPDLNTFAVLGGSTVVNTPTSAVGGNVGVWSSEGGNVITGFQSSPGAAVLDPQVSGGLVHAGTTVGFPNAMAAQGQLTSAITNLGSLGSGTLLVADLAGLTLFPGVYTVSAGPTNLSGALTLDGQGNANAAWVFQLPSTLVTSANAAVSVINTGAGAGLFWNVGSSATIGTNTAFLGNILALASITMNTDASDVCGRVLASNGAVTLNQNDVSRNCLGVLAGSDGLSGGLDVVTRPGGGTAVVFLPFQPVDAGLQVPEPGSLGLTAIGLLGAVVVGRRRRLVEKLSARVPEPLS